MGSEAEFVTLVSVLPPQQDWLYGVFLAIAAVTIFAVWACVGCPYLSYGRVFYLTEDWSEDFVLPRYRIEKSLASIALGVLACLVASRLADIRASGWDRYEAGRYQEVVGYLGAIDWQLGAESAFVRGSRRTIFNTRAITVDGRRFVTLSLGNYRTESFPATAERAITEGDPLRVRFDDDRVFSVERRLERAK